MFFLYNKLKCLNILILLLFFTTTVEAHPLKNLLQTSINRARLKQDFVQSLGHKGLEKNLGVITIDATSIGILKPQNYVKEGKSINIVEQFIIKVDELDENRNYSFICYDMSDPNLTIVGVTYIDWDMYYDAWEMASYVHPDYRGKSINNYFRQKLIRMNGHKHRIMATFQKEIDGFDLSSNFIKTLERWGFFRDGNSWLREPKANQKIQFIDISEISTLPIFLLLLLVIFRVSSDSFQDNFILPYWFSNGVIWLKKIFFKTLTDETEIYSDFVDYDQSYFIKGIKMIPQIRKNNLYNFSNTLENSYIFIATAA